MKTVAFVLLLPVLLISVLAACNGTGESPLPRSMKGYELYSWQEQGEWHFTLITGTNRNKFLEEIVTGENTVSEDGWVKISASGVEEIKDVLSRVPENEFVSWNGGQFVLPTEEALAKLVFPPDDIVNEIKDHAALRGLDFLGPFY